MEQVKRRILLIAINITAPIITIELFAQFKYQTGFFSSEDHGLHKSSIENISTYTKLYGNPSQTKKVLFRTDKYGTIIPSHLEPAIKENRLASTVLFCGGSTTEAAAVTENQRPTDVFSKISGIQSINTAVSGKGINGCIKTLNYIFANFGNPSKIAIATNVNTLMNFGIDYHAQQLNSNKLQHKTKTLVLKTIETYLPGIWHAISDIKMNRKIDMKKTGISPSTTSMEEALEGGCCHGAGRFNRKDSTVKLDWSSDETSTAYSKFVAKSGEKLKKLLEKYQFPLNRVFILIEPNSYNLRQRETLPDYRQFLHGIDSASLGPRVSYVLTSKFDKTYSHSLSKLGFKIFEVGTESLKPSFFYDAVHLTPEGSEAMGIHYSKFLK